MIALAIWLGVVGFLAGGVLGTSGKVKFTPVKQDIRTIQTDNAK
jgi:hypothetical protein